MGALELFQSQGVDTDAQYTTYAVRLRIRNLLVGGVPASPNVIRKWLEARLEVQDQALEEMVQRTLQERFGNQTPDTSELLTALVNDPEGPSINGFKRDPQTGELVLEGRCVKAAFKEWSNSTYPGTEWPGKTVVAKGFKKGLMNTLAERVFIPEVYVGLGVKGDEVSTDPGTGKAWIEERIKHVMTPQGPKSAINRVEVVVNPTLDFHVKVHDDFLPQEAWARIWQRGEDIGLGADRGRSDGQFDLLRWEQV